MKKITKVLVSIICLVLLTVFTTGCADKVDKKAIRQEQVRIAEYTIQHFENIQKIEFKDFEKNPSTGTWSSHAVINNEIHITYRVNDLSGKSEIGIDSHISVSNGKEIKRKKNNDENESGNSKDAVEVHYWEG
ncbi:hypothetical protein [Gemella sanguinis]|uniref:hypothetical protein n=1 Tax=Gemella sanguinis TaxID=84135 RepID=UPI00068EB9F6|nr:hypothetical protein [Gemella sanguinis]NKZ26061.1 DUF1433 domain-containing protein [Gemella sanguinis]